MIRYSISAADSTKTEPLSFPPPQGIPRAPALDGPVLRSRGADRRDGRPMAGARAARAPRRAAPLPIGRRHAPRGVRAL